MVLQPLPSCAGLFRRGLGRGAGAQAAWPLLPGPASSQGHPHGSTDPLCKHSTVETCPGPQKASGNPAARWGFFLLSAFFLNSGIKKLLGWEGGRFYSPAFLAVISSRTQISLFQRGNKGQRSSRMDFQMASSSFLGAWLHLWITYTGR